MSLPAVDHPEALLLLLLAVPILWRARRRLGTLETPRRRAAVGLRLALLLLLTLAVAGLRLDRSNSDLTVVALVDRSDSVRVFGDTVGPAAAGDDADDRALLAFVEAASADRRPDDRLGLVTFDARPTLRQSPRPTGSLTPGSVEQPAEGTDPAAALRSGLAAKGDGSAALRLVLASDGNATAGDLPAAARSAAAAGVPVDVVPVPYRRTEEVMVEGVYAPPVAREGQSVPVRVVLAATAPAAGTIELLHDGDAVDLNGPAPGSGLPVTPSSWTRSSGAGDDATFTAAISVDVPLTRNGPAQFEAIFEAKGFGSPVGGANAAGQPGAAGSPGSQQRAPERDRAANNRATGFTQVAGPGRVLLIDNSRPGAEPGRGPLATALRARGIELDARTPAGVPNTLADFTRYDSVIFANVPADPVNPTQQELLTRYVAELGGGFVMIGGPTSFGAGGWTNSVVDRELLPVTCAIPNQTVLPSGALVLVIDRSGSMDAPVGSSGFTQMQVAAEAAALALGTLYPNDLVGVVVFDGESQWIAELGPNRNPNLVATRVRAVRPGGGTNIYAGLEAAFAALDEPGGAVAESAIRHVILLTDGASAGEYGVLVPAMKRAGVTVSTIGVGDGHERSLLARIARDGGGTYHPVDDPRVLPQVFVKEARVIRQNLIKEDSFLPAPTGDGSPITRGTAFDAPLRGMILTGERNDPRIDLALRHPDGEPLFAHWQVGLGRVAAFTSDASTRWAAPWTVDPGWPGYADFWTRTVRAIGRPTAARDAELLTSLDGDTLRLTLEVPEEETADRGPNPSETPTIRGAAGSTSNAVGGVLLPDGTVAPVELSRTGPGRYEGSLPAPASGNYVASVFLGGTGVDAAGPADAARAAVYGGTAKPPGPELRAFAPDLAALRRVAELTGGRVLDLADPAARGLFARDTEFRSVSSRPIASLLLPILVVLLLLDAANRRIAWDARAAAAWLSARLSPTPQPAAATATLGALKNRDRGEKKPPKRPAPPRSVAPAPAKTFEPTPADQAAAANSKPVSPTIAKGQAGGVGASAGPQAVPENDADAPSTSRLLAARRRAREGG